VLRKRQPLGGNDDRVSKRRDGIVLASYLSFEEETRVLPQMAMIERVRELVQQDDRIVAAMLYGSFTRGEGDQFSDIEFIVFVVDSDLPSLNQQNWVAQIGPLELYFADAVGHHTAIFSNLIRGEFHFEPASAMSKVAAWQGNAWFPSYESTILLDRTGDLSHCLAGLVGPPPARDTPRQVESLSVNFINWVLFGSQVLARGEHARALELLGITHRYLLWMVRLLEGATDHWPTPTKGLERDISAEAYQRFTVCTATLDQGSLRSAYETTWRWGRELMGSLAQRHNLRLPLPLLDRITDYLVTLPH
jgi:lincosamide nucleotidyltransferase B/F